MQEIVLDHEEREILQKYAARLEKRMEFYLFLGAFIAFGLYTVLFVYAVSDWRRDQRDRVLAKLLRSFLTANREASGTLDEH